MSNWEPISVIAKLVESGQRKAIDNVTKALNLIEQNESYNSIICTTAERALERAKFIDEQVASGKKIGRLAGVPFIAKDNILVFGADTTAASNILKGFDAPYQATVIDRLEAEGAICVAKANLDAFAHGSSTENSDFFTTKNPHDTTRVPGGSSGGSAAATALDLAPFALGTDTGGSIRQPASFTGTVGLKPSYGLVSRSGVIAMASSTDVVGPIANTVEDAALVLDAMSGRDELDSTTIEPDGLGYANADTEIKGKKFGVVKEYMGDGLDPEVRKVIDANIDSIRRGGGEVVELSLPSLPLALAVYYILCPAEVSSNLSRYDGQRFGLSDQGAVDLNSSYSNVRSQGFNKENKRRIIIGTYVLSSGYYDAYYKKAQIVRTKIINDFNKAFEEVDYLIGPTAPDVAFKIGENTSDPLKMYLTDIMTVGASLAGIPAISLPSGFVGNLPVGVQVMAPMGKDRELLGIAKNLKEIFND